MKRAVLIGTFLAAAICAQAQTYLDLQPLFDVDAVLEPNGTGIGNALDAEGRRIDAATLPPVYTDGSETVTQDGRAKFKFGPFKQSALDAVRVNGQVIQVAPGLYESLDLAMLSAPGALAYPFGDLELRYTDGSKDLLRLGPVPGWFNSPMAFDHTLYRFTDSSQVQTVVSFRTDFGDGEAAYIFQEQGNGNSGGNRFVDGNNYVLYRIGDLGNLKQGTLGVTVGNNFVISLATEYYDPSYSTTDGYTVVANSMVIYDGFEHRALGNLKQYDIDLAPFLSKGTGEIYILFTDATTSNGWGPYIQQILLYTGTARTFEQVLEPVIDTSKATVHAMFRTATDAEKPFLYDNSGSGPSNRGHRFADGSGSITYRFDLPDEVTQAKLTVDMANNFVVSLSGPSDLQRYFSVAAATADEKTFLVDEGGSIAGGDFRFADASAYMIYQFDLPDDVTAAFAQIHIGNQFVIEAAAGTAGNFKLEKDWVAETGEETTDISNLDYYYVDLAPYLANNPSKIVQLRFSDGIPANGWGPYLKSIVIQNRKDSGQTVFTPVLEAQTMFGEDIHNEYNKKYYTLDLAAILAGNPKKEFMVKFTDGSTADGWGPGIFWMAVHTGDIAIQTDQLVFNNLKTTQADPANYGAAMLHRRYPVNSAKNLSAIAFPTQPSSEDNRIHLLAATLNDALAAPSLKIERIAENKIRLSWPASASGFKLQSATSLGTPVSWNIVQESPQTVGNELVLEVLTSESAGYYRLVK
ncbi:MAG TPA: hypothetical protein P5186_03190 [Candidatus Paceibacterota bacterium]|nr:hypothetical protein [Verrucomicrobiota bacterium]HRY47030.1 hypothetical protein [Candidatus Paceibacterota bacterium]HSA00863.1 hypothetical protein [Candidatus Paceibacterota bacterium]